MSQAEYILLEAKDCTTFKLLPGQEQVMHHFVRSVSKTNTFYFSTNSRDDENLPVAEYDYATGKWWAGRLVGEATFAFEGKNYKVIIKPRFGELFLFRMLEEIFNVKLAETSNSLNRNQDFQFLIKKLISFLWLNMLANANKHGLPRNTISKIHKGQTVRGRINVPRSIKPYYTTAEIVSNYREKEANETIAQILFQAYDILLKEYSLGTLNFPNNAKDAIIQLEGTQILKRQITNREYKSIRYKDIYQSYKPAVDFSWDIIQRKSIANNLQAETLKQGYSFFIDIAEIWELYLKSLLKKHFSPKGWILRNDRLMTYPGKYFQRYLIPDIVFQRKEDILVFDAKYKRMYFDSFDIDRTDFFQIHTYINYYQQDKNVIIGGLLYPLSIQHIQERQEKSISQTLYGSNFTNTKFITDGIDISFLQEGVQTAQNVKEKFKEKEEHFVKRIYSELKWQSVIDKSS